MKVKLKLIAIPVLLCFLVFIFHRTVVVDNALYVTVFPAENEELEISAKINVSDTPFIIRADYDEAGAYYLFMPSYTKDKHVIFETGREIEVNLKEENLYSINDNYQLYILYGSSIPSLHMSLENDLSYVREDKENVDSGKIAFISAEGVIDYKGDMDEIKGRGNTSWELDKKPFQFKLTEPIELYDIPLTNEFSLVSNRDYSFMRNYISNEMAECMGSFTLSCTYIDLYINNEYQGIYEFWNKLEPETLGIANLETDNKSITDMLTPSEQLTTGIYFNDWNNTVTGKWWDYADVSQDITGGYLLEGDYALRYDEEASGFILDSGAYIVSKSPKYLSEDQYCYISEYMKMCEKMLFDNVEVGKYGEIQEYIDVNSFISKYLVEEVSKNVECSSTSQYFYKDANGVLYAGPVWDYDSAYAAVSETDLDDIDFSSPEGFAAREIPGSFIWWQLLYYTKNFYDDMTYVYNNILYPYLNELTAELIPQWELKLADSAVMTNLKWKRAASVEAARLEYHNDVTKVSDFLKSRKEFLYQEWN